MPADAEEERAPREGQGDRRIDAGLAHEMDGAGHQRPRQVAGVVRRRVQRHREMRGDASGEAGHDGGVRRNDDTGRLQPPQRLDVGIE